MKIYPPELISVAGWTECHYRIEFETPGLASENLLLAVSDTFSDWTSSRMEAPVMASLFLAMALGEPIRVTGPISPRFHYGMRQICNYFHMWYPNQLSRVDLLCDEFEQGSTKASNVATCFSAGVDTFYTLWSQQSDREPLTSHQINYGLFVHGFDISLDDYALYDRLAHIYEDSLAQVQVRLVRCRTNIRSLIESKVDWMTLHGAAIQAVGLFLQSGLTRLFIPSTNRVSLLNPPIGSNPYTDPLSATESLEFIHHGCEASRIQKIQAIADWPLAQKNLRVCFQTIDDYPNCGHCPKCHKVMAPLWILDRLHLFTTFPPNFDPSTMHAECFDSIDMSRYAPEQTYAEELSTLAESMGPKLRSRIPFPINKRDDHWIHRVFRRASI